MSINYQNLLPFSNEMPITIRTFTSSSPTASLHRHSEIELLFILSGTGAILVNNKSWPLIADDVVLINENTAHEIISSDFTVLSILFRPQDLRHPGSSDNWFYNVNSSGETKSKKFNYIRHLIAQLVKVNSSGENIYMTYSLIYALVSHLYENFLDIASSSISASTKYRNRITEILSYIDNHFHESITLNDLANELNLSVPYLSSFFKKNMQKTFSEYYNDLRLFHAVSNMLSSDDTLENIAINNGFPDSRSFVTQFKKKYDCTPSVYRQNHTEIRKLAIEPSKNGLSPQSMDENFKSLAKYLNIDKKNNNGQSSASSSKNLIDAGIIDFLNEGEQLKHNYRNFCCVGSARQLLYEDVRNMLKTAQKTMKYKYIKFHGILSDEMMVYSEAEDGSPS